MANYKNGLAFRYVQGTKYHSDRHMTDNLGPIPPGERSKSYLDAELIHLPKPDLSQPADLWECLDRRRSERNTSPEPISLGDLSKLMWAAQGVTARVGMGSPTLGLDS